MPDLSFQESFKKLTGFTPLSWQIRLFVEHFAKGGLPAAVDIPTGLGKTAVMALWLIARAKISSLPRRLIYVVDRRAVVDQATEFAIQLQKNLDKNAIALKTSLGLDARSLPISTLRGQHMDNREWLEDPASPAIIVGTVDMIGSRLLFEGYGVSRKMRPYHAGLLGADTLVVLDEAHLVPPFERLLESIETGLDALAARHEVDRAMIPKLHLLSLSATGRERQGEVFRLADDDLGEEKSITRRRLNAAKILTITDGDAKKLPEELADAAWALTESGTQPIRCLVYCNSRDQAEKTRGELEKRAKQRPKDMDELPEVWTELFIGARRGHEREVAADRLREFGFLAGSNSQDDRVRFLVATSAGEVGVDLDADHMICDLVAWDRMVQRLGRVNRRGDGDAQVKIIAAPPEQPKVSEPIQPDIEKPNEPALPTKPEGKLDQASRKAYQTETKEYKAALKSFKAAEKKFDAAWKKYHEDRAKYDKAMQETWIFEARRQAIKLLGGDGSPAAIQALSKQARRGSAVSELLNLARSEVPLRPALTRALLDAWSMTSLREHTGRPEVAPWLRGWVDDEPQTVIIWRAYFPVAKTERERQRDWFRNIEAYFEAAPLHISEQLETETRRVADWLVARAKKLIKPADAELKARDQGGVSTKGALVPESIIAIILTGAGDFSRTFTLKELSEADKKRLQRDLIDKTLIVLHTVGGLAKTGTLDPKADGAPAWLGDFEEGWEPETRKPDQRAIRWRVVRINGNEETDLENGWRWRYQFVLKRDEEGEITSRLAVYKWKQNAANEEDRAIGKPQSLVDHQNHAAKQAREIGERLGLPETYIKLLTIAARLHDEGKQAERWQRAFNAPARDRPYAKTTGPVNVHLLDGYRHEFGSLFHTEQHTEFQALNSDQQELVLHLIAAHHGNARPTISTRGCDQAPPSALESHARDVALRFARLQRRWGPWGLAWWESLLRAADQQASRDNEKGEH